MGRAPGLGLGTPSALLAFARALAAAGLAGARASAGEGTSLDEELHRVATEVGALRGRTFKERVPARTASCASASTRLLEIARAEGARCSPDIERAVVALGFIERDPPAPVAAPAVPGAGRARAAEDDDASHPCGLAFYDQIKKEVVVVEGRSTLDERAEVLAHELSHALQDQLFDLRARLRAVPRTASGDHDAEELAVNAAINEGEATAIELLHLWNRGADRSAIQGVALGDPLAETSAMLGVAPAAPRPREERVAAGMRSILRGSRVAWPQQRRLGSRFYFHALARFQYLVGCSFVAEAYRRGGWELVDRLRSNPPLSTSQLLHPEKYFDRLECPVHVPPSPFAVEPPGGRPRTRLLYENRLGELGTLVAIQGDASGWRGDGYRVLGRASDGTALVEARSLWDSGTTALQFVARSAQWLRTMNLAAGTFDVVERRGRAVVIGAGIRDDELASFRDENWKARRGDPVSTAGADAETLDRTVGLRRRGPDGSPVCELRLLEPGERDKALEVLKAHLDGAAHGTIETDGRTWGLRSRPGGGVSWVEERTDGRIIVATAQDRTAVEATRAALLQLSPVAGSRPSKRAE